MLSPHQHFKINIYQFSRHIVSVFCRRLVDKMLKMCNSCVPDSIYFLIYYIFILIVQSAARQTIQNCQSSPGDFQSY
jgi:hypothetical protein